MKKILFILKKRFYSNINVKSYGLINSSTHIANFLDTIIDVETKVVTVVDANGINKEVQEYKPDMVIIEALWVTGEKMKELIEIKKYKHIKWVVRIHSDIGYLSAETFALKYVNDYIALDKPNLFIAPNNEDFNDYLSNAMRYNFTYLPNVIITEHKKYDNDEHNSHIMNVGCFGALRLLKNPAFQALCAIKAANILGKTLHFHVTLAKIDGYDDEHQIRLNPILKNLEEIFANSGHMLVKHEWKENKEFQHLVKKMDIGMQLSFSESFNIVTADFINNNKLILVSEAIDWMPCIFKASTIDYDEVTKKVIYMYEHRYSYRLKKLMHRNLDNYNRKAKKIWFKFIYEK
jgi:hypothetical protein